MWSREIIKSNAKAAIRGGKYWTAFLVSAIIMVVPSLLEWVTGYGEVNDKWAAGMQSGVHEIETSVFMGYNLGFVLLNIFILLPLIVGVYGFFVRNRFDAGKLSDVTLGFRNGYGNVVLTSFVTNLFIGLWALLLIIPGIYKTLQYVMVPFLLSDNPRLSGRRVRQISRLMTDGEKGAILVLSLSFIGWFLIPIALSMLLEMARASDLIQDIVITLGFALVMPYYYATIAELYIYLRDRAIQTGMVQPGELNLAG
ncbi:DUF975 family protein [Faecalispora anaeroviscerum]|uniref:DUF975 family protein n=1 Tax=Faecalispora anaeroviscerum TaxID=2991836 RepID=UPI0024BA3823|nr:DUF975 family protein [Faecalispora anaeroviscerum]